MSDTPTDITFSDAYEELKQITAKLNGSTAIPPDELISLIKRGKGLELALRAHLDEVSQQVSAIEKGDGLTGFRIVQMPAMTPTEADPNDLGF